MTESVEVGSTANSYEILAKLATGGMAEIFLARGVGAAGVSRHVVLKRILGEHATDANFVAMFLDEARLVAQLQHPNIAQIHDVGTLGDSYFFTMEYVHGETVRALLQQSRSLGREIPLDAVLAIVAGAAAGLLHAHERLGIDGRPLGIVHRDVTPSNLMVSFEGNVKVVDFGVAKAADRGGRESKSGTIKGKTTYLSPEQCKGLDLDCRSDLFSLGIVMWEMLATERLFRRASEFDSMTAIVNEDAPAPSSIRPSCPKDVDTIVLKLLARDRANRFANAAELIEAIEDAAVANKAKLSASTLARVLRDTFGTRLEPWIELERRARANLPTVTVSTVEHGRASEAQLAEVPGLELLPERRAVRRDEEISSSDLAIAIAHAPQADSDGGVVAPADDSPTMRWSVVTHPPRATVSVFDAIAASPRTAPKPPARTASLAGTAGPSPELEELFTPVPASGPTSVVSATIAALLGEAPRSPVAARVLTPRPPDLAVSRSMTPRPGPAMSTATPMSTSTMPRLKVESSSSMPPHVADDLAIPVAVSGGELLVEDDGPTVFEPVSSLLADGATAAAPRRSASRQKLVIVAALAGSVVLLGVGLAIGLGGSQDGAPGVARGAREAVIAVARDAGVAHADPNAAEPAPVAVERPPRDAGDAAAASAPVTPGASVSPAKPRVARSRFVQAELTAAYGMGKYGNLVTSCAQGAAVLDPSLCVLAACRVGNQARAKQWYASTPYKRRGSLLTTCMSLGVPLDGSQRTPRPD